MCKFVTCLTIKIKNMKVSELKKLLENVNDDFNVVLEVKVEENNGFMVSADYDNIMTRDNSIGDEMFSDDETGLFILGSLEIIND